MKKFEYSIYIIFLFFIMGSGAAFAGTFETELKAASADELAAAASLLDETADISCQLNLSNAHKKLLNAMAAGLIGDPYLITAAPELKGIADNSLIRFFVKTAFESILTDISLVSFSYSVNGGNKEDKNGLNDASALLVFTFGGVETADKIFETKKDLLEMIYFEQGRTSEIKVIEDDRSSGYDVSYAEIEGKICGLALVKFDRHLVLLYRGVPSPEKFSAMAQKASALVFRYSKNEKSAKFDFDKMLRGFDKANNLIFNVDLGNFDIEETSAAELIKGFFIGAKLKDDLSSLGVDSCVQFNKKAGLKSAGGKAGAPENINVKTMGALRLIFRPLKGAVSAADYLSEDISLLAEFNLNFNDEFLALTDIFVFRGILLTATGIDYKDDFLSWFDGNVFFALGGFSAFDMSAAAGGKKQEIPEAYVGLKSKNAALADKCIEKLALFISDYVTPLAIEDFNIGGIKARTVKVKGTPDYNDFEIAFGQAGGYYLIASSVEAFKKQAARGEGKPASKKLSATAHFATASGLAEGRFFNLYVDYRAVRAAFEKTIKARPEFELIVSLPLDFYSSGSAMAENGDIDSRAILTLDKDRINLMTSKFNVKNLVMYFDMLDKLLK
ncbi:MAG: hypothetical protein A2008_07270 [Candidatus Wallbacteria bacterium GWC2_49_35]|uniref:DUF4836 family protein n=1 Tax=Candidatus Wallbacteria bacterium GWC2_49_35 TaxID=1817813 RepID=A0A1F7WLN9_9BACT|nr:MAG: hypothetical protein A2008_07270 [Candidatus Wallbacteria bacterium GWC2_49_35]HBC74089.1 hypothetical protein [Candidatus Wallbacteria bacterium]